jgi:hypothetical protein
MKMEGIFSYPFSLDNAYAEQVASSFSQLMARIEAFNPVTSNNDEKTGQ